MTYDWLRALHIIGALAWFAGLAYIFRLYVYHVENAGDEAVTNVLAVMERRLYRAICWPAMVWTTGFGLWLLMLNFDGYMRVGWFHTKLLMLAFLFGYHFHAGKVRRDLLDGSCTLTSKQCRMINEIPTVAMLVIVIMAVVEPF